MSHVAVSPMAATSAAPVDQSPLSPPRSMRRGACPSLIRPMQTGDGLLVRLAPPAAGWPAAVIAGVAEAAARFGNGVLEVSARGRLQLRGFSAASIDPFTAACDAAGLTEGSAVVASNPLGGENLTEAADPRPLADAIARELPQLAPKVSVLVDGGGTLNLDGLQADLRLCAEAPGTWHLWAESAYVGPADAAGAVAAALRLLRRLACLRPGARMRDLLADAGGDLMREVADLLSVQPRHAPWPPVGFRPAAEPLGLHHLRTSFALGIGLPFGTTSAANLIALAAAAQGCHLLPAPGRALLLSPLTQAEALSLRARAAALGFITDPADSRGRIVACPGAPACASGQAETRPLAARLASRTELLPAGIVHVSGCAKGCAHPGAAALTLVGQPDGFGLIRNATAGGCPIRVVPPTGIEQALGPAQP